MSSRSKNCTIPSADRCEALIKDCYNRWTNLRCGHYATVRIKGRRLCIKHASMLAMKEALRTGSAKRIHAKPLGPGELEFVD